MRIKFRQGLVSSEINGAQQPNYLVTALSGITIRTANRPTVFTVADGPKNYTISFTSDVLAWPSSMYVGIQEAWLYIDINRSTSQRTYGITTVAPQYGLTAPKDPVYGQHWFDTRQYTMKVFNETNSWQRVLRVIAGKYTPTQTTPMHIGTQIGIEGNYLSGSIMTDGFNKAIVDSKGQFITTEDVVMVEGAATHAAKLESNVDVAPAKVNIPAFHVVAYGNDGQLRLADYDDVGVNVIGLSISNAVPGEPVSLVMQGKVHNTLWNWPRANMTLWVDRNGELTPVDPFAEGGRAKRRVPVARTIDVDTVLFDQGLGGVGEKGDSGDVTGIQPMSPTIQGTGKLTVPAVDQSDPIVVGDNDPRMSDARVPLAHKHNATDITTDQFGNFQEENAQQALEYLDALIADKVDNDDPRMSDARVPLAHDHHATNITTDQFGEFQGENAQQALEYLDVLIADKVVHIKRVTTDAEIGNVVAAFNALSVQERTLHVNQVLIVEWTTDVYVWGGGYGSPVTATSPDQFLLVGKLVTSFSIRAVNAVTAYEAPKYSDLWIRYVLPQPGESSPCGDNTRWGGEPAVFGIDTQYDVDGNAFTWNSDAGAWKHGTLVGTAPDLVTGIQLAGRGSTVEFSVEFSELPNAVSGASFIDVRFSNDIGIQLRPSDEDGLFWRGEAGDIPNGISNFFDDIVCVEMSPVHPH